MSQIYENIVKSFAYISLILELSKGRKLTGYDILVHVKRFGFEVSPGTVYYQLGMLENSGIIKGTSVKRSRTNKTVYEMTEEGRRVFEEFKEKWRDPIQYTYRNMVSG